MLLINLWAAGYSRYEKNQSELMSFWRSWLDLDALEIWEPMLIDGSKVWKRFMGTAACSYKHDFYFVRNDMISDWLPLVIRPFWWCQNMLITQGALHMPKLHHWSTQILRSELFEHNMRARRLPLPEWPFQLGRMAMPNGEWVSAMAAFWTHRCVQNNLDT